MPVHRTSTDQDRHTPRCKQHYVYFSHPANRSNVGSSAFPCWLEYPWAQGESTRLGNNPKKPLPNFCPFSDSCHNSITIFYKHIVENIFYWQPKRKKMKQQPCGKSRVRRSGYFSWLCFRLCDWPWQIRYRQISLPAPWKGSCLLPKESGSTMSMCCPSKNTHGCACTHRNTNICTRGESWNPKFLSLTQSKTSRESRRELGRKIWRSDVVEHFVVLMTK